jgi:hypothetical protein
MQIMKYRPGIPGNLLYGAKKKQMTMEKPIIGSILKMAKIRLVSFLKVINNLLITLGQSTASKSRQTETNHLTHELQKTFHPHNQQPTPTQNKIKPKPERQ